jgi:hypothetical protein
MSQVEATTLIYKIIPSFPDYGATEDGQIISLRSNIVLKAHLTHRGYHTINLYCNKKRSIIRVHRAVMEAFCGGSLLQVNHKDGNKTNNHISNLEYTTTADNRVHGIANNLIKLGEHHNFARLKDAEVIAIRTLKGTLSRKMVADLFNVSASYIGGIWNNKIRVSTV